MLQRSIVFPDATPGDDERSVLLRCDIWREGYISRQNGEGRGKKRKHIPANSSVYPPNLT
jgi:hypothetical protein